MAALLPESVMPVVPELHSPSQDTIQSCYSVLINSQPGPSPQELEFFSTLIRGVRKVIVRFMLNIMLQQQHSVQVVFTFS